MDLHKMANRNIKKRIRNTENSIINAKKLTRKAKARTRNNTSGIEVSKNMRNIKYRITNAKEGTASSSETNDNNY